MVLHKNKDDINELLLRVRSSRRRFEKSTSFGQLWLIKAAVNKTREGTSEIKGSGRFFYPGRNFQNSVVKVSYAVNHHSGQWKAHGRYLEREGAQIEGRRGKGFSAEEEEVDLSQKLDAWQKEGDGHVFKIIVSPEQAERMDLKVHVRHLMQRMESDLGTRLEWMAIDHYNTDDPHVHIVLRGKDEMGNELIMNKNYIKKGIRFRSREEATRQIGVRLNSDILRRREKTISQNRLTELDRDILRMKDDAGRLTFKGKLPESFFETEKRLQILGRLQYLEAMGFVSKTGVLTWNVSEDLEDGLKTYQMTQDIIKRKTMHLKHISDPSLPLVYTQLKEGQHVVGRVVGFGLHNEQNDKRYMLIEGLDGKIHYTHPKNEMIRQRDRQKIKNGDTVHLQVKSYKKNGVKKTYLSFTNWGPLSTIERTKSFTKADQYAIDYLKRNREDLVNLNTSTFRGKFIKTMKDRLDNFQKIGILSPNMSINKKIR